MLQIQPIYNNRSDYEALADSQGLFFEALELSFDNVSEEKYEWYKTCGKVGSLHGAFIDVNPGSGDGVIRELSEKRYEESCLKAIACGAKNVVFHSTCFPFLRGGYLSAWADKCADFYNRLAEKYGELDLFIENSPDITPEPIAELIKRVSAPNVKVCLDIGHINYSHSPIEEWFEVLGEKTGYLHLSDNTGIFDDHLPLGKGTVDWKKASALCAYLPESTPVTLEVGNADCIKSSLEYLSENGLFGGIR